MKKQVAKREKCLNKYIHFYMKSSKALEDEQIKQEMQQLDITTEDIRYLAHYRYPDFLNKKNERSKRKAYNDYIPNRYLEALQNKVAPKFPLRTKNINKANKDYAFELTHEGYKYVVKATWRKKPTKRWRNFTNYAIEDQAIVISKLQFHLHYGKIVYEFVQVKYLPIKSFRGKFIHKAVKEYFGEKALNAAIVLAKLL